MTRSSIPRFGQSSQCELGALGESTENRASKSTLLYPIGFSSFLFKASERDDTTSFVTVSSVIAEVMSRRLKVKVHFGETRCRVASIYVSSLKSDPDRRTGTPLTV
jgi:hypothetical protein